MPCLKPQHFSLINSLVEIEQEFVNVKQGSVNSCFGLVLPLSPPCAILHVLSSQPAGAYLVTPSRENLTCFR